MSLSNTRYIKRSWFVALILHLVALALILIGYFIYLYQPSSTQKQISVDNNHVISADLLSFQQTESALSSEHLSKASDNQVKLSVTQSGDQVAEHKTSDTQKVPQGTKQTQQDESKKQSANAQHNSHQVSSQAQVNHYMASLASYLYQQISKDVAINHQAKGDIYATISVNGKLSNIEIKLQEPNQELQLALDKIILSYKSSDTITELEKPIRVRIPFQFN